MKKIFTILTAVLLNVTLWAQSPEKMSYQAVIRNSGDALVTNTQVGMQISILQGSTNGTAVYVETQTPTTNANGLVSIEIGSGSVISGTFANIDWANGPYFIKTETDTDGVIGGITYTITGTSQLLSVPYALHAKTAENIIGGGSGGSFSHYIGEQFGGGVIFHLWKDAQGVEHGLIVALNDQSTSQVWSNINNAAIGVSAQSSWDGLNNSIAIVAQAGHTTSAAQLCLNYTGGGQNDWYLPSIEELILLWHNSFNVQKTLRLIGGATILQSFLYWSSTECSSDSAWPLIPFNFEFSANNYDLKSKQHYVRAVRAF